MLNNNSLNTIIIIIIISTKIKLGIISIVDRWMDLQDGCEQIFFNRKYKFKWIELCNEKIFRWLQNFNIPIISKFNDN